MLVRCYGIYAFECYSMHVTVRCQIFLIFQKSINILVRIEPAVVIIMVGKHECCKINAVVTMDAKGQIVLPKDLREKAKLNPGDKLAVIGFERDGDVCCIAIVKNMLGPILNEALK
jgi:AbrB family looped-hinge helix DNA binding protein